MARRHMHVKCWKESRLPNHDEPKTQNSTSVGNPTPWLVGHRNTALFNWPRTHRALPFDLAQRITCNVRIEQAARWPGGFMYGLLDAAANNHLHTNSHGDSLVKLFLQRAYHGEQ